VRRPATAQSTQHTPAIRKSSFSRPHQIFFLLLCRFFYDETYYLANNLANNFPIPIAYPGIGTPTNPGFGIKKNIRDPVLCLTYTDKTQEVILTPNGITINRSTCVILCVISRSDLSLWSHVNQLRRIMVASNVINDNVRSTAYC